VDQLLELVELEPSLFASGVRELSGGEQQRVGLARALAAEPEVVLLDEPFGALDPLTRDRLQSWFGALRRRLGFTAIFVTHDMVEALLLGDRIAVLHRGRLVQVGTPTELLNAPADSYVAELMATPRRQAAIVDRFLAAAGAGRCLMVEQLRLLPGHLTAHLQLTPPRCCSRSRSRSRSGSPSPAGAGWRRRCSAWRASCRPSPASRCSRSWSPRSRCWANSRSARSASSCAASASCPR
jgi:ABC-type dipeptide/oligopeptide/nickel transport system ATPase component